MGSKGEILANSMAGAGRRTRKSLEVWNFIRVEFIAHYFSQQRPWLTITIALLQFECFWRARAGKIGWYAFGRDASETKINKVENVWSLGFRLTIQH